VPEAGRADGVDGTCTAALLDRFGRELDDPVRIELVGIRAAGELAVLDARLVEHRGTNR
jgi:hypothetical protein